MDNMTGKLHKMLCLCTASVPTKFHVLYFIAMPHVTLQCCCRSTMQGVTGDLSLFPALHLNVLRYLFKPFLVSKCSKLFISVCMCNYIVVFVGSADILEKSIYFSWGVFCCGFFFLTALY